MTNFRNKTLLVVAPHADDEVLGCGGLTSKIKELGGKVYVLFLTNGNTVEFSKNGNSRSNDRVKEIQAVVKKLGIDGWRIAFPGDACHLKLDQLPQKSIITEIERGKKISLEVVKPDIIAFPMLSDYNQDHRAAAEASLAACRPSSQDKKHTPDIILSYEAPFNTWAHPSTANSTNCIVKLSPNQLQKKVDAMNLYTSQVRSPGHPRTPEAIRALAQLRGSSIGSKYAEGYYCHMLRG